MKKETFVNELSKFCEFENENYDLDTPFVSIENYDSMALLSIIAYVDDNFNMRLTAEQLRGLTDFQSLINLIGEEKFC